MGLSRPSRLHPLSILTLIFGALWLLHLSLLKLPYYWDEAGYFVPAAHDIYTSGRFIPFSTLSNAHPPLVMTYLAVTWKLFGFHHVVTRTAMLFVAAVALLGLFRLAERVTGSLSVAAATVACTALYPVFFAQSSLAHLDMMVAALTMWALVYYLPPLCPKAKDPPADHFARRRVLHRTAGAGGSHEGNRRAHPGLPVRLGNPAPCFGRSPRRGESARSRARARRSLVAGVPAGAGAARRVVRLSSRPDRLHVRQSRVRPLQCRGHAELRPGPRRIYPARFPGHQPHESLGVDAGRTCWRWVSGRALPGGGPPGHPGPRCQLCSLC